MSAAIVISGVEPVKLTDPDSQNVTVPSAEIVLFETEEGQPDWADVLLIKPTLKNNSIVNR